jgi:hypothetical protein
VNQKIAKQWAERLRTDTSVYQITKHLGIGKGRCCLGVLCDMAFEQGVIETPLKSQLDLEEIIYDGSSDTLPVSVQDWAEMNSDDGRYDQTRSLADDNDEGTTFAQIADIIEEWAEQL